MVIRRALENHEALSNNDNLVDIMTIIDVLMAAFEKAEHRNSINLSQSVDLTLNWILNVYDR